MTEQMQDSFERLVEIDSILAFAARDLNAIDMETPRINIAREKLQETTAQLREDYGQMARTRGAVVEFLTKLRDRPVFTSSGAYFLLNSERDAITQTIVLLQGAEEKKQ